MPRSRPSRTPILGAAIAGAFLVTLALFLANFAKVGLGVYGDGMGYYAPLRSLLFDGNLDVSEEYRHFSRTPGRWPYPAPTTSKYTIGLALVLLPFYLLGHGAALLLGHLGLPVAADGLSWPYELFYCLGSLVLGVLGLLLCYRGAERRYGSRAAALAVIGVWFASPLTYYLIVENSMSHAVSQFLVSAFLYMVLSEKWPDGRKLQLASGAVLGLATLVRPQDALFGVVPLFLSLSGGGTRKPGSRFLALLITGLAAAVVAAPQSALYLWQYGRLSDIPYLTEGGLRGSFDWLHPKIVSVLFSDFHGLFSWHPITLLAVLGLLVVWKRPRENVSLLLALALQVYVVASWYAWPQGSSLGGRMFGSSSYVFVAGLAALWGLCDRRLPRPAARRVMAVAPVVTAVLMVWNALLSLQYRTGMLPADRPVPLMEMAAGQLRIVPHLLERLAAKIF